MMLTISRPKRIDIGALYVTIQHCKEIAVTVQIAPEIRQFKVKNVSLHG